MYAEKVPQLTQKLKYWYECPLEEFKGNTKHARMYFNLLSPITMRLKDYFSVISNDLIRDLLGGRSVVGPFDSE